MERKSNIELLRIVAMFMIVGSHLACHGVQSQLLGNNAYQICEYYGAAEPPVRCGESHLSRPFQVLCKFKKLI